MLKVSIRPTKTTEGFLYMVPRTWRRRFTKVEAMFVFLVAKAVYERILDKLPTKDQSEDIVSGSDSGSDRQNKDASALAAYRDSLMVSRFGAGSLIAGYAVHSSFRARKVRREKAKNALIYVRAQGALPPGRRPWTTVAPRGRKRVGEVVAILEKYSPWTYDTIPYIPTKRDKATVIIRSTSRDQVNKISKNRLKDKNIWEAELQKVGFRPNKVGQEVSRGPKVVPQVIMDAVSYEFGMGGKKNIPHWRPAISRVIRGELKAIIKSNTRQWWRTLSYNSNQLWQTIPPKATKISITEVKKFAAFQKKLGIRLGGA